MKNKILIICHDYLPLETPNSFRWSSIAEYWVQQGHDVYVVCGTIWNTICLAFNLLLL